MGRYWRVVVGLLATALLVVMLAVPALAVPGKNADGTVKDPDRPNPRAAKALLAREAKGGGTMQLGTSLNGGGLALDNILVILVEFAGTDVVDGRTTTGPMHNEMTPPVPGDNTTYWISDFSPAHYESMLFDSTPGTRSMYNYYLEQSGGAFATTGTAVAWVQVPHSEAYYGANDEYGNDRNPQQLVRDAVDAVGGSIDWSLFDEDGEGGQKDGVVDHLMLVHAGADESAGGGAQGTDAIWAHSWSIGAYETATAGISVDPYTIMPEDGTIGVFAHEFGHDLGLPDVYDTIYSGEESAGFWTLMSSGSWLGAPGDPLGVSPANMSMWEKWSLGWIDYVTINPGAKSVTVPLKAAELGGRAGKAIRINLPDQQITTTINEPWSGKEWWSGKGDNLSNTLTRSLTLPDGTKTLSFKTWYDIEQDFDYAAVQISTDGGSSWTGLAGNLTTTTDPYSQNPGNGITGSSGGWVDASFDLSAYNGPVLLRFYYWTDVAEQGNGWCIDDMLLTAPGPVAVFSDNAESLDPAWSTGGWSRITGSFTETVGHYYVAEWREPIGFDASMLSWYNWRTDVNAEFFRASPGLLLWYRNLAFTDNWVGVHPWQGFLQVVDSKPTQIPAVGTQIIAKEVFGITKSLPARTRIQIADAAFGTGYTYADTLYRYLGRQVTIVLHRQKQTAVFDDKKKWIDTTWEKYLPIDYFGLITGAMNSVKVPTYGLKITVLGRAPGAGGTVRVNFPTPTS